MVKSRYSWVVLLYSEIMRTRVFRFSTAESHKIRMRACLAMLTTALLVGMAACSSGNDVPGMASGMGLGGQGGGSNNTGGRKSQGGSTGDAGGSDTASGNCAIGTSRACRVVLGIYNGIESCFVGMQYCDVGSWTHCIDPRDAN